jgi:hypothetical protein
MANVKVYSRSNVSGNPFLWQPLPNRVSKNIPISELGKENICDNNNDFKTTYMTKRIWIAQTGVWSSPPYVQCNYVE